MAWCERDKVVKRVSVCLEGGAICCWLLGCISCLVVSWAGRYTDVYDCVCFAFGRLLVLLLWSLLSWMPMFTRHGLCGQEWELVLQLTG